VGFRNPRMETVSFEDRLCRCSPPHEASGQIQQHSPVEESSLSTLQSPGKLTGTRNQEGEHQQGARERNLELAAAAPPRLIFSSSRPFLLTVCFMPFTEGAPGTSEPLPQPSGSKNYQSEFLRNSKLVYN